VDGEIAVDARLAAGGKPGDALAIVVDGTVRTFRVSGVVAAAGPRAAVFFTDAQAARLDPRPGSFDAIGVLAEPDADRQAVLTA
jgi:putative ABC transport system permease protein